MALFTTQIAFDEQGREIPSPTPVAFHAPQQERFSVLDYHRQRLLDQRQALFQMLDAIKEDEYETFAEADDFAVEDPLDPDSMASVFELDDDGLEGLERLARAEYKKLSGQAVSTPAQTKEQPSPQEG